MGSIYVTVIVLLVVLLGIWEASYRWGNWRRLHRGEQGVADLSAIQAGIPGPTHLNSPLAGR